MQVDEPQDSCDVVIVNYNAGGLLQGAVASASEAGAAHIIVVDNASVDGSMAQLEGSDVLRLITVHNERNLGFAAACNAGARLSSAPFILFLNPDCVLLPDALRRLRTVLQGCRDAGMAGGMLLNPDGSEQAGARRDFPTPASALVRAFGLPRLFPGRFPSFDMNRQPVPPTPTPVPAISGACMLVKREALEAVGPWDDGYFLHCEDLDWCMRFHQKGWQVLFVPDARVMHVKGASSRSRPVFVEWHKHRGMLRFYRKFYRQQYPVWLWPLVVLGVWLRFALAASYLTMRRWLSRGGA